LRQNEKNGYLLRQRETVMGLLLDENLSDRVIPRIVDLYPDSLHVKALGLVSTDDGIIWEYAKTNGFIIVSKDSDFHQRSILYGHPPKFIYLRIGNSPTSKITQILRDNVETIAQFEESERESILILA
jgi:predicted nuclease of predicted toxin-antitoxin system